MSATTSTEQVAIIARYPLRCASETAAASLESPYKLGPLDHMVLPFVPVDAVFVYKNPISDANRDDSALLEIERLQRALALVLDYCPHLTGRLHFDPKSHRPEIVSLGMGAELLEAQCSLRLDDIKSESGRILLTDLPDSGNALLPFFDSTMEGVCRDPILAIQHTRFACGSVALGIRIHHIVCDACGFFEFVRDLAQLYRALEPNGRSGDDTGTPTLPSPPDICSYLRDPDSMTSEEHQAAFEYSPSSYYLDENPSTDTKTESLASPSQPAPPPVLGRVLRFSSQKLQELKAQATDPNGRDWVSTNDALVAYLYQLTYRARLQHLTAQGVPETTALNQLSTGIFSPINMRSPTRLNLSPRYFPNCVYGMCMYLQPETLASGPLWKIAKAFHDISHGITPGEMKQTTQWLAIQPDKSRIKMNYDFNGSFTTSQWSKFDMYVGTDFDVDQDGNVIPPVVVSRPFTDISRVDGLAMVMASEEQFHRASEISASSNGPCAVYVNYTLSEPLWAYLDKDEEFRELCCS
ncbi:hypothetical protein ASPBRDRAFT_118736 [Aspergillus brasiliensis CBS 101740]|uniref:Transferase n=1 Tax=Aspergillus brasiliensis (strain CBS 101740 / IMI 381727 / IBT 21946) TaxID=767769 RepID=A0A1L9URK5_ASPBC|nr:hypothetical protein ASPBRDRAFT_118736 [Aspergillus brasiliensis CBS 101740]